MFFIDLWLKGTTRVALRVSTLCNKQLDLIRIWVSSALMMRIPLLGELDGTVMINLLRLVIQ
jgi:hypothetical protein